MPNWCGIEPDLSRARVLCPPCRTAWPEHNQWCYKDTILQWAFGHVFKAFKEEMALNEGLNVAEEQHVLWQHEAANSGDVCGDRCGWVLNCSTLATEYRIISESASVALSAGDDFSNLWMDCVADTTGVSDCKYYPSMLDLPVFLHVCRALAAISVIYGFWGAVLALTGMKFGGFELISAKVT
ncbi:claudin-10-like [Carassius auratus]|uniref:Claudin n=1 Tax=Carassius auratus TaxID=7957 RepID=A0A6P6KFK7_CARAU|nr:claudin-10-like [Carassius auratus]